MIKQSLCYCKLDSSKAVVLDRRSADRCQSTLAFVPVRNNLFPFYTLRRFDKFRSRAVLEEY